ncbi:MAG TPA: acyltransferase [Gemmataceae bacterium]|nr:acyltransferase [Gemmataceae bacterium]
MVHSSFSRPQRGRLTSIDALRALAALAVLVGHIPFTGDPLPAVVQSVLSSALRLGRLGVPLFLVLSGFCIHLSVARRIATGEGVRSDWGRFWKRRFWRLYPAYVAAILFSLIIYAVAGADAFPPIERITSLPWNLLTHLLLIHNLFVDYCFSLGNGPFWTLGLEEQLYALYALFLLLRRRWPIGRVVGFTLLVSLAWQCGWHVWSGTDDGTGQPILGATPFALGRWLKWPIGLWFAWILGAVAAEAYAGAIRLPEWLTRRRTALLLAFIGLATSHAALGFFAAHGLSVWGRFSLWPHSVNLQSLTRILSGFSDLAFSGAAFVLLNRWVRQEAEGHFRGRLARTLGGLGVISYSLYLIHVPLVRLLVSRMPAGTGLDTWLLRLFVIVPACLGVAGLFFFLVERHFLVNSTAASSCSEKRAPAPARVSIGGWIRSPRWRSGDNPSRPSRSPSTLEAKTDESVSRR